MFTHILLIVIVLGRAGSAAGVSEVNGSGARLPGLHLLASSLLTVCLCDAVRVVLEQVHTNIV